MPRYLITYECKAYHVHEVEADTRLEALTKSGHTFTAPHMPNEMNGVIELDDNWTILEIQESEEQ